MLQHKQCVWTFLSEKMSTKASEIVILHVTINLVSKAGLFILPVSEIHAFATTFLSTSQQKSIELSRLRCPLECKSLSSSTAFTSEHVITSLWSRRRNERVYPGVKFPSLQSRAGGEEWLSVGRWDRNVDYTFARGCIALYVSLWKGESSLDSTDNFNFPSA